MERSYEIAETCNAAARQAMRDENEEEAYRLYHRALAASRLMHQRRQEAQALLGLANVAMHYCPEEGVSPFDLREELAEQSLAIFEELEDRVGTAAALRMKSCCASTPDAKRLLDEALQISRSSGDKAGVISALVALALRYKLGGEPADATRHIEEAYQLARELGDDDQLVNVLASYTTIFSDDNAERRRLFGELFEILERRDWRSMLAGSYVKCSLLACDDDPQLAASYIDRAYIFYKDTGNVEQQGFCLSCMAETARAQGDMDKADELDRQARLLGYEPPVIPPELLAAFEGEGQDDVLEAWRKLAAKQRGDEPPTCDEK